MGMFELIAPIYDPAMRLLGADFAAAAQLLEIRSDELVLDVGGGTGLGARAAVSGFGCRAVVMDRSQAMLRHGACGDRIACVQANAQRLPFAAASMDGALCLDALHHFAEPVEALREIARVVKPSRRLVIVELDHARIPIKILAALERLAGEPGSLWDGTRLADMVRQAGLGVLTLRYDGLGIVLAAETPRVM
ncbi:MAG: class I SAM-dependent methyltransferase [Chloroflexota bacterium]